MKPKGQVMGWTGCSTGWFDISIRHEIGEAKMTSRTSAPSVIGTDIGEDDFHLVSFDAGKMVLCEKIKQPGSRRIVVSIC